MKGSFGVIPPDPIKRVGDFALRYCGNLSQVFEKSGKLKKPGLAARAKFALRCD